MTYEEAISVLTKDRALCLFNPLTGDVGPLNEDCRMSAEAMNLAIEALEKQIPKKPCKDNENGVYEKEHCPSCHRSLFPNDHHCECGQAIDWSDNE